MAEPRTRILINAAPAETRLALVADGRLTDYVNARAGFETGVGAIFLGRVAALSKPLRSAFVEIGAERPGLLAFADLPLGMKPPPDGTALAVRLLRAATADKGAKLTARLDPIPAIADGARAPALLVPAPDPIDTFLAAHAAPDVPVILDDRLRAQALRRRFPALDILDHTEPAPLFAAYGVEEQLEAALRPDVPFADGASLVIEETAALTAIDVNSGPRAAPVETNLAAVPEIARALRLRNLAGQVAIDFVAMKKREDRTRLLETLRAALADDPGEVHLFGLTRMGLAELTRRRRGESLAARLGAQTRIARSPETAALDLLRTLDEQARYAGTRRFALTLPPAVAAQLDGPLAEPLAALVRRHALELTRTLDPALPPDIFRL